MGTLFTCSEYALYSGQAESENTFAEAVPRGGTYDLWRHRTSVYQDCGRGHIAAFIELGDTIFAGSASI